MVEDIENTLLPHNGGSRNAHPIQQLVSRKRVPLDFEVQVARSVEEAGREVWDRLSRGRPFTSYRWYRFAEKALCDDMFIYIVLSSRQEPVAGAALRLTRQEVAPVDSRLLSYIVDAIQRRWPVMICQTPLSSSSALFLPDLPLRDAALETIAQVAMEQAKLHQASFLVFACLENDEAAYPGWPDHFAAVELPNPETHLEIKWSNFESYINHLSRRGRKHYRQRLRYADEMGLEISLHPTVKDIDTAMNLIQNVEKKYKSMTFWSRRLMENAHMVDSVWIAAKVGEQLVGCELMLGDQGHWLVSALGRDYEFDHVYFLLGYTDIRYAIEQRAETLQWGICSYDVKRRFDFQLGTNNYAVFSGNGPLLHRLGQWLGKIAESELTDPYAVS